MDQSNYDLYVEKLSTCLKTYQAGVLSQSELKDTWSILHDMMVADYLNGHEELEGLIEDLSFRIDHTMH